MAEIIVLAQKGAIVSVSGMDILIQNTNPTDAWIESDVPTVSQMQQYLSNVNALRSALAEGVSAVVPSDMDGLTITEANSIEQVLSTINDLLVRMVTTFVPAGTATSGGDYL